MPGGLLSCCPYHRQPSLSHLFLDAFLALGAFVAPTAPMMASGAYLPTTSGGWIISNSAVASLPANVRIASSPPGCADRKLVTLSTWPCKMTQQSSFVVCL